MHAWRLPVQSLDLMTPGILMQVSTYVVDHFGFDYGLRGWIVLILLGFVAFFRIGAVVGVTKLTFVKR